MLFAFVDHQLGEVPETAQWLADLLATPRARAAKFRVLVQHLPIYGETGNTRSAALLETVKAGGIDLVLSGHMHGYERIEKDGFIQLTNGGLGCLDHHESCVNDYGDCTKAGGHNPLPYLWARQRTFLEPGVLGPAEPVRLGMVQGYGELAVSGNVLTYRAHGFNADGSYIGVFDTLAVTSKTVAASAPAAAAPDGVCPDPGSFADYMSRPVTNAKWKEFADAVGLPFAYPEGAGDQAVTGVSKTEIGRFLAWLNGTTADYRLPTREELAGAFDGNLARDVSEWTSSVDPATGRCLILGGNTNAVAGTWCRAADRPMVMTADCSANYLGFRLWSGPMSPEPVDPFAEALAQIGSLAEPASAYCWRNGELVDISGELVSPKGSLAYTDPVILTGEGDLTLGTDYDLSFLGGLAAPKSVSVTKNGAGTLTLGGSLKGGPVISSVGWTLASRGGLRLQGVSSDCTCVRFASGDGVIRLSGVNDLKAATLSIDTGAATDYLSAGGATKLIARAVRDYGDSTLRFGEDVTLALAEDLKCGNSRVTVDGVADMAGFNETGNYDPLILGSGTLRTTYIGSCQNSYIQLGVSNVILTSSSPWRQNAPKPGVTDADGRRDRVEVAGNGVRLASLYDWTMPAYDHYGIARELTADVVHPEPRRIVFDTLDADDGVTPHTFVLAPLRTSNLGATPEWGFDVIGPGKVVIDCDWTATGACTLKGGTLVLPEGRGLETSSVRLEKGAVLELGGANAFSDVTCAGGTLWSVDGCALTGAFSGPFVLDQSNGAMLVMRAGLSFDGTITLSPDTDRARVRKLLEGVSTVGLYEIFKASGLTAAQVDVTHDLPAEYSTVVSVSPAGDVNLVVMEGQGATATWIGQGDRSNPLDSRNWTVTAADGTVIPSAVPDATTSVILTGETSLNVPAGTAFACKGLVCSDLVTLTADCDWCGLGTVGLRAASVLDLNGHRLALSGMTGTGAVGAAEITDLTANEAAPGTLCVDVAAGAVSTNDKVRISGNLKLVKAGAGTFRINVPGQRYTGGTFVDAGTLTTVESPFNLPCGPYGKTLRVAKDATLDRYGRSGFQIYRLILDGGTLTCSYNPAVSNHEGEMGNLELTDDSRIVFDAVTLTGHDSKDSADLFVVSNAVWELNGHTLDIVFDGYDPDIYCRNGMKLRHGTVRTSMKSQGWFHDQGIDGKDGGCLDLATILRLNCNGTYSTISNLILRTTSNNVSSEGYQKVYGTFKPVTSYAYKIELQNGATLDLTGRTGAWPIAPANSASHAATFADNATIAVDLGALEIVGEQKVIGWTTAPTNLSTLKFVKTRNAAWRGKLRVEADGVWAVRHGMSVVVR